MKRIAFYLTVDDNYTGIGKALALRLRKIWGVDVHIFQEGSGDACRDEVGVDGVFLHVNQMKDVIPNNLPSTKSWPRIVYGRIFAPYLLPQYDTLIYIDSDIYPVSSVPEILDLDLGGGIAAVQDGSTIGFAPHTAGLTRDAWRESIGLREQRYFNAGLFMLDQKSWSTIDFAAELGSYMVKNAASAKMQDQDFLNYYFQGRWIELSPRLNYQKAYFNYGYEDVFPLSFVHFSSFQKPWLKPDSPDSVHGQFFPIYQKMMLDAGVDPDRYLQSKPDGALRKLRTTIRRRLSEFGIKTSKESRQRAEWERRAAAMFHSMQQDAKDSRYFDMNFEVDAMPRPQLHFDGRYLRRSLDIPELS